MQHKQVRYGIKGLFSAENRHILQAERYIPAEDMHFHRFLEISTLSTELSTGFCVKTLEISRFFQTAVDNYG